MEWRLDPRARVMDAALEKLAQLYGIEPGYHDIWGNWRATPEETLRALLAAMGVEAHDAASVEERLHAHRRDAWANVVPPVTVLRSAQLRAGVRIQLRDGGQQPLSWRITEESGETRQEGFTPLKLAILEEHDAENGRVRAFALPLPP